MNIEYKSSYDGAGKAILKRLKGITDFVFEVV